TAAILAGADEERPGPAIDLAFAGIEHALEEVLHHPGHVAEVLGRAKDEAVGGEQVLRAGVGAALHHDVHAAFAARATLDRRGHRRGLHAAGVIDDEQGFHAGP